MITYSFLTEPTLKQIDQIIDLYRIAGWWDKPTDDRSHIQQILAGSHCMIIAAIADEIVGMGRSISDRVSDAYLQDVTVKHPHRRQGIGTRIVMKLVARLQADNINWIGVIAESGAHKFYQQFGFEFMPNASAMLFKSLKVSE